MPAIQTAKEMNRRFTKCEEDPYSNAANNSEHSDGNPSLVYRCS